MKINNIIWDRGDELLEKENVVGVARGYKDRTGEEAVVVLVRKKKELSDLSVYDVVPKEIEGVITDVIEVGEFEAFRKTKEDRKKKHRPLIGGISCIWERGTACTLGSIVYRNGKPYLLSNTHCFNPHWKGAKVGDEIRQPSPNDFGRNSDRVGVSTEFYQELKFDNSNNPYDASLCEVDEDVDVQSLSMIGTNGISNTPKTIKVGEVVKKSGRTTGYTESFVTLTNATVYVNYGDGKRAKFMGQTIIASPDRSFSDGGDSGSLIVDKDHNPVGLLFAGSSTRTIISPIKPILKKFDISFSPEGTEEPKDPITDKFIFTKNMRRGDFNDEVMELQKRLSSELSITIFIDGIFGAKTEIAVKSYQRREGLVADGIVGAKSRARLNGYETIDRSLLPIVERQKQALIRICELIGKPIFITDTYRTYAEQNALYAKGRTTDGNIVTNARGGYSLHNHKVAFDIAFLVTDASEIKGVVDKEKLLAEQKITYEGDWGLIGEIGKALNLKWGGDWSSFIDRPHFQYTAGYSIQDFILIKIDYDKFK